LEVFGPRTPGILLWSLDRLIRLGDTELRDADSD